MSSGQSLHWNAATDVIFWWNGFKPLWTVKLYFYTYEGMSCYTLQWRHNGRDGVSNHQRHDCLLNRLFRRRSKKTSKLRVTGLCEGNSLVTGEFPAKMASDVIQCFHLMTSSRNSQKNLHISPSQAFYVVSVEICFFLEILSCYNTITHVFLQPGASAHHR